MGPPGGPWWPLGHAGRGPGLACSSFFFLQSHDSLGRGREGSGGERKGVSLVCLCRPCCVMCLASGEGGGAQRRTGSPPQCLACTLQQCSLAQPSAHLRGRGKDIN